MRIDMSESCQMTDFREHTLFWAALAVVSFAYGTYVLMAWSPGVVWPSDLPRPMALGFYVACLLSVLIAFLARKN